MSLLNLIVEGVSMINLVMLVLLGPKAGPQRSTLAITIISEPKVGEHDQPTSFFFIQFSICMYILVV
jgi:hypothetical protein